jgi:citrate lyase subunit beta/citryl-CoA lyase
MQDTYPLIRRSVLILPVTKEKFINKAWERGADAIQLDLEDSIADSEKDRARGLVREAIPIAGKGGADVLVRINHNADYTRDLYASIYPGLHTIILPKVEDALFVNVVEGILQTLEVERGMPVGTVKIGVLIETAKGFMNSREILGASKRIVTVALGTEDFTMDLEIEPSDDGTEIFVPKIMTVIAARAAGVKPMGLMGSTANYRDLEGLYRSARAAYKNGYIGSSCIHPDQVPVLNQAFSPAEEAIVKARKVIEVYEKAMEAGEGATSLNGEMIDAPIVRRAYQAMRKAAAIAAMDLRKQEAIEKARC